MNTVSLALQVKQFVGEINGPYCKFRVFKTGAPRGLLFCALDEFGCDHGLHIPVKYSDLSPRGKNLVRNTAGGSLW